MKKTGAGKVTEEEVKALILREVPRLIRRDPQIKEFLYSLTSPRYADKKQTEERIERILGELKQDREENQRRWEAFMEKWEAERAENQKRWDEHMKKWEEERAKSDQRWEEHQKAISALMERLDRVERRIDVTLGAVGARWGLRAESSFREAVKGILEEYFPIKVERARVWDESGAVFGRPDQVELDMIIRDGLLILIEIKSSLSKGDVAVFLRKIEIFEKKFGKRADRYILLSPMVERQALELALFREVKVYGYPEELDIAELQNPGE